MSDAHIRVMNIQQEWDNTTLKDTEGKWYPPVQSLAEGITILKLRAPEFQIAFVCSHDIPNQTHSRERPEEYVFVE